MTTRTSWPMRARYLGSAPTTSPSPPSLAKGAASEAENSMESGLNCFVVWDADMLCRHALPILQELIDAGVGQRVFGELNHDRIGDGGDIGADKGRVEDMDRVAHAGHDDLGHVAVVVEDGADLFDDPHAVLRNIVKPADKGRYVRSARLGRQKRLHGGENQGHIGLDPFCGQGV